jgi:hypothetical protein
MKPKVYYFDSLDSIYNVYIIYNVYQVYRAQLNLEKLMWSSYESFQLSLVSMFS